MESQASPLVEGTGGRSNQISGYTDQAGNPVSEEHMFRLISESMLANVIAFEEAGVPLKDLKQAVGRDGVTIIGRGVVFQTPINNRLTEDDARELIERYSKLVGDYSNGQLDRDHINNVKPRSGVSSRISMIRSNLRDWVGNATGLKVANCYIWSVMVTIRLIRETCA